MPLTFAHLVRQRPVEENDRLPRRDPPRLSEAARTYGRRRYPARGRSASKRPPRHMRLALPIVGVGVVESVAPARTLARMGRPGRSRRPRWGLGRRTARGAPAAPRRSTAACPVLTQRVVRSVMRETSEGSKTRACGWPLAPTRRSCGGRLRAPIADDGGAPWRRAHDVIWRARCSAARHAGCCPRL